MRGGTRLKKTRQRPLTPSFSEIKTVFNFYIGTRGGPS